MACLMQPLWGREWASTVAGLGMRDAGWGIAGVLAMQHDGAEGRLKIFVTEHTRCGQWSQESLSMFNTANAHILLECCG